MPAAGPAQDNTMFCIFRLSGSRGDRIVSPEKAGSLGAKRYRNELLFGGVAGALVHAERVLSRNI
jgi:hypothetical protein